MKAHSARIGIGLKAQHANAIDRTKPAVDFFEIHAENYFVASGPYHHYLERIRSNYALSIHGVGLSIGGDEPLNTHHLAQLAALAQRYQPQWISEHLAWSSHAGVFANDLLPLPYTQDTLSVVCNHIDQVQQALGTRILLENPSTYLAFASSSLSEGDFITEVVRRSGCGLLLDVNNVHVSCHNQGLDPLDALRALPLDAVGEIHLAGYASQTLDDGSTLYIDNHGAPVDRAVWDLYSTALQHTGTVPTLIERDTDVPELHVLVAEAHQAKELLTA